MTTEDRATVAELLEDERIGSFPGARSWSSLRPEGARIPTEKVSVVRCVREWDVLGGPG
jgi:hypothetical protein